MSNWKTTPPDRSSTPNSRKRIVSSRLANCSASAERPGPGRAARAQEDPPSGKMGRTKDLLPNCKGALKKWLGLFDPAQDPIGKTRLGQPCRCVGVFRAEHPLSDRERALEKWFGIPVARLSGQNRHDVAEAFGR